MVIIAAYIVQNQHDPNLLVKISESTGAFRKLQNSRKSK